MDLRERIKAAIAKKPGATYRSISLSAGLSDSMLQKFMTGQTRSITVDNLEKIADALGVPLRQLMFGDPISDNLVYLADRVPQKNRKQVAAILETFMENGAA
jgi:transcriptional regulator with XRE-family HTH domain